MNLIFIGTFYPDDRAEEIRINSKNGMDNASNVFQKALINGLYEYDPNFKLLAVPTVKSYPYSYKKIRLRTSTFTNRSNDLNYCIGYVNIPIVKLYSKYINLLKQLNKMLNTKDENVILIYSIHSPLLRAVYKSLKRRDKTKTCLLVPDLPEFMSENKNLFYLFLKKIDIYFINRYLKKIDSFVLLTENMKEKLPINNKRSIVVEGIYDEGCLATTKTFDTANSDLFIITYTGTLEFRFGIENLLSAFSIINNSNFRLWICGSGNAKSRIIEMTKVDLRITYWGELSVPEVRMLQKRSSLLVNPRTSLGEYVKYSFPSKTIEYMASKTPCLLYRLPGMPVEYLKYVYIVENEDVESLKDMILEISKKGREELKEFGELAADFIIKNKSPYIQAGKIYNLLNEISNDV